MTLPDIALVAANTARSKAYIQMLVRYSLLPSRCYLLVESEKDFTTELVLDGRRNTDGTEDFFNINESVLDSISKSNIPYEILGTTDINSDKVIQTLRIANEKYFIYSGYGGCILRQELFHIGKEWIHVHAGILPDYRGSTTAYYSILKENMLGATAIFMNERIDEGSMIAVGEYPCPQRCVNIDYIYEPYIRAKLLVKVLKDYSIKGIFPYKVQDNSKAETYYIIHPLLKHIAILGLDNELVVDEHLKRYVFDE